VYFSGVLDILQVHGTSVLFSENKQKSSFCTCISIIIHLETNVTYLSLSLNYYIIGQYKAIRMKKTNNQQLIIKKRQGQ
jgi:hypothetical protein